MRIKFIGVAGPSGSGKTTIVEKIYEHYGAENCTVISSDNYYKDLSHMSFEERAAVNFDHPDSIDFDLLTEHLSLLKREQTVEIPMYDFTTHSRKEQTLKIFPKSVIIVEGILVHYPKELAALYDIKIFVDTDLDICFIRRLERDVRERGRDTPGVIAQYMRDVKPMHRQFVAPCKAHADIIIENTHDHAKTHAGVCIDVSPLVSFFERQTQDATSKKFKFFPASSVTSSSGPSSSMMKQNF